jgi:hypothetical protein
MGGANTKWAGYTQILALQGVGVAEGITGLGVGEGEERGVRVGLGEGTEVEDGKAEGRRVEEGRTDDGRAEGGKGEVEHAARRAADTHRKTIRIPARPRPFG